MQVTALVKGQAAAKDKASLLDRVLEALNHYPTSLPIDDREALQDFSYTELLKDDTPVSCSTDCWRRGVDACLGLPPPCFPLHGPLNPPTLH